MLPIVAALIAFFAIDSWYAYRESLRAINTAYDRTLLASARAIGDGVKYVHETLTVSLPYPALEVFEADVRSRMVFRVSGFEGEFVSGYRDLPAFVGERAERPPYAALVTFYEDRFRGETVRVAALLQPVSMGNEYRMATVQVAETLELRRQVVQATMLNSLVRKGAMLVVLSLFLWWVVGRGLSPLLRLRQDVLSRDPDSLEPLVTKTSRELVPVVDAMNEVIARLRRLIENRQRFVRDASHQLRTPLAAIKIQVQNARQGLIEPLQGLAEVEGSVDRATRVANQMLSLAKVAELGDTSLDGSQSQCEVVSECRDIAVECSPLIAARHIEFSLDGDLDAETYVRGEGWLVRELLRNLVSNAIHYTPEGGACGVVIEPRRDQCAVYVWDSGVGLAPAFRSRMFQAFSTTDQAHGTGLGLLICRDICNKIGATLAVINRPELGDGAPLPSAATGCVARILFERVATRKYGDPDGAATGSS